jgi:hypothetical protein
MVMEARSVLSKASDGQEIQFSQGEFDSEKNFNFQFEFIKEVARGRDLR